jgi:hypothetical protein
MQHFLTLLLDQIALTQPGGVLGHCPVENQMIVGLCPNQMGWGIAAESVVAMLVKCALNSKYFVTSKAPSHNHNSSMLYGGKYKCGDHPFTHTACHNDMAVRTKYLQFVLHISTRVSWPKQVL